MQACRNALRGLRRQPAHAGLLLAFYLENTDDKGDAKRVLLKRAQGSLGEVEPLYRLAFERWSKNVPPGEEVQASGRIIIGLGGESVLETALTLHHTYGTPLLPGTALKGLAAHYCNRVWGATDPEFLLETKDGSDGKPRCGRYYQALFGAQDDAGHITFYDAWITPDSLRNSLVEDVMTPHHAQYYMGKGSEAPTDFDEPNPVTFLSVRGRFRLAVGCDVPGEEGEKWRRLALRLLTGSLAHWGIGGKTNSGYGRFNAT
jgi:CRISPR-associated protein Cmr6